MLATLRVLFVARLMTLLTQDTKLEKAVAVSGTISGFSRNATGKARDTYPETHNAFKPRIKFSGTSHQERQACREPWVDTLPGTLSPPSERGVF